MADLGHELTDEMLAELEKKIAREYAQAAKDMRRKLREYMEQFEEGKAKQKALLDAGKITKKEYKDWCFRHTMMGQQWRDMKNVLAEDLQRSREMALAISRGQMADIYALNANYATYQIEHDFGLDTSFTLYNHDTAEYLLQEQRQLMPVPSGKKAAQIAANKALQWDMQHIQSAVLQGILQGESPFEIAKRLRSVAQMDYNASVRYARTMTTSAQNAGRYQAYRRAKGLGVDLTIEWSATLDGRTRHDHRMMHGQHRDVDQPFKLPSGQEILYPADSSGDSYALQGEIWNCRCTLLAWVKGFEGNTVKSSPKMEGMSFDEWQHAKEPKPKTEPEVIPPSFAQTLAAGGINPTNFWEAFGNSGEVHWDSTSPYGYTKSQRIENTLAELQKKYPMQSANGKQYNCTVERVITCDYQDAWQYLPDGKNDRRLDYGATAQVFENTVLVNGKEVRQAVIAFDRDWFDVSYTLEDAIQDRAEHIAEGKTIWNLGGFTNAETTTIHEWGHIFEDHMTSAMIYDEPAAHEFWEWYQTLSKEEIRQGISDYATTNRGEFSAECFLEMQMPNPRPLAVKWWGYMERVLANGY